MLLANETAPGSIKEPEQEREPEKERDGIRMKEGVQGAEAEANAEDELHAAVISLKEQLTKSHAENESLKYVYSFYPTT